MRVDTLKCRACGATAPAEANYVCVECFGPMGVVFDEEAIRASISREAIASRAPNLWRYHEVLPIAAPSRSARTSGVKPLAGPMRPGSATTTSG